MNIIRINNYRDTRFSQSVMNQHGCFLADGEPYEVEIVSEYEAEIRGREAAAFPEIIEEFRFYTPHISVFYDKDRNLVKQFPPAKLLTLQLSEIQPSQFYVDEEKVAAVGTFLTSGDDIIIQVMKHKDRYISLDGHTRLFYAVMMGWRRVRAVEESSGDYIFGFVEEALSRNIYTPYDLQLIPHDEYEIKWNRFCDDFFARKETE